MANVPHALLIELKDLLAKNLSPEELDGLIFALDISDLPQRPTQALKAQEVVTYLNRRNRLTALADVGPSVRDDLPWVDVFKRHGFLPVEAPSSKLDFLDLQRLVPILSDYSLFQTPATRASMLKGLELDGYVNADLNGSAKLVANGVLVALNEYGRTPRGDFALGRLLNLLLSDDEVYPDRKSVIRDIVARYSLA